MVPMPVPHSCYHCRRRTGLIVGVGVLLWASSSADSACIVDNAMESKRNSRVSMCEHIPAGTLLVSEVLRDEGLAMHCFESVAVDLRPHLFLHET